MRKIRLTESDLRRIVNKSVKRILKEDIDDDTYFGGGLPDSYFNDDEIPDNDRISKEDIIKIDSLADEIANIANNRSDDCDLLFQALDLIEEFIAKHQ